MSTLRKLIENSNICTDFLENELLSQHTTFKIGGKADLFISPSTKEELTAIFAFLQRNNIPCFILGGGSNLVISDDGIEGAVLCTQKMNTISSIDTGDYIELYCGCGVLMNDVCTYCAENSFTGFEAFAGLPGTVGGALYMNARCYGTSVSDILLSVSYFDTKTDSIRQYQFSLIDWDYKKSPFQLPSTESNAVPKVTNIILEAVFRVYKGSKDAITEKNAFYIHDREQKGHFRFPSAGSAFKNNRTFGVPSGKIIDETGLKGFSVGGAQIAPWHGNLIINTGNATAQDVRKLVEHVISTVAAQKNLHLEPEIIFTGKNLTLII